MIKPQYVNSDIYLILFPLVEILMVTFHNNNKKKIFQLNLTPMIMRLALKCLPLHISLPSTVRDNLFLLFTSAIAVGFYQSLEDKL